MPSIPDDFHEFHQSMLDQVGRFFTSDCPPHGDLPNELVIRHPVEGYMVLAFHPSVGDPLNLAAEAITKSRADRASFHVSIWTPSADDPDRVEGVVVYSLDKSIGARRSSIATVTRGDAAPKLGSWERVRIADTRIGSALTDAMFPEPVRLALAAFEKIAVAGAESDYGARDAAQEELWSLTERIGDPRQILRDAGTTIGPVVTMSSPTGEGYELHVADQPDGGVWLRRCESGELVPGAPDFGGDAEMQLGAEHMRVVKTMNLAPTEDEAESWLLLADAVLDEIAAGDGPLSEGLGGWRDKRAGEAAAIPEAVR